jgi:hypothetical protein
MHFMLADGAAEKSWVAVWLPAFGAIPFPIVARLAISRRTE